MELLNVGMSEAMLLMHRGYLNGCWSLGGKELLKRMMGSGRWRAELAGVTERTNKLAD